MWDPGLPAFLQHSFFFWEVKRHWLNKFVKGTLITHTESSRYVVSGNETVIDTETGLMWTRCPIGLSGSNCSTGTATEGDWKWALETANSSTHAGFSDWRVPNVKELDSLAAHNCFGPAINAVIFPNTPTNRNFASSTHNNNSVSNFQVYSYFSGGIGTWPRSDGPTGAVLRLVRINTGAINTDPPPVPDPPEMSVLNDTGVRFGANYPTGNSTGCSGITVQSQDCFSGNDNEFNIDLDGHAGFSFQKLDSSGSVLRLDAVDWACVEDRVTGLVWEVKSLDGGLQDSNRLFRWGGTTALGRTSPDSSKGEYFDDWNTLVEELNFVQYCGYSDWRVPTTKELESITVRELLNPAADVNFFPNTREGLYWSANPDAENSSFANTIDFRNSTLVVISRNSTHRVRMVRSE